MTMTITIEMSAETEAELRASIARHDTEGVRQLLAEILTPTVESMLQEQREQIGDDEFERLLDQLAELTPPEAPVLSDYAVSRAAIYEDHP